MPVHPAEHGRRERLHAGVCRIPVSVEIGGPPVRPRRPDAGTTSCDVEAAVVPRARPRDRVHRAEQHLGPRRCIRRAREQLIDLGPRIDGDRVARLESGRRDQAPGVAPQPSTPPRRHGGSRGPAAPCHPWARGAGCRQWRQSGRRPLRVATSHLPPPPCLIRPMRRSPRGRCRWSSTPSLQARRGAAAYGSG